MVDRQPKTAAGRRTLTTPAWLLDLLADQLARRSLTAADRQAYLFVGSDQQALDDSHRRDRTWVPATRRAGLAGLHFHDRRRTAATALVQEHVDIKTAQPRLGHADPRTTLAISAQATPHADRDAAARASDARPPMGGYGNLKV